MSILRTTALVVARRYLHTGLRSNALLAPRLSALPAIAQSKYRTGGGRRWYAVLGDEHLPNKRKVWDSVEEAIQDVKSGDILLSGGMDS